MVSKWLIPTVMATSLLVVSCASDNQKPVKTVPSQLNTKDVDYSTSAFRADAPDRYIVKPGDTLWQIANKFLANPARWKEIWYSNPHIANPNLIYPGDIISFTKEDGKRKLQVAGSNSEMRNEFRKKGLTADGRPIYTLKPSVRVEKLDMPIPTIPYETINPFITKNRIMKPGFASEYPYIVSDSETSLSLSHKDKVYAKGTFKGKNYDVFRESDQIIDPVTNHLLGVEARFVGKLKLIKDDNADGVATFAVLELAEPIFPNDALLPEEKSEQGGRLSFLPSMPKVTESPIVIKPMDNGLSGSQFQTLLINQGRSAGIVEGNVFKIVHGPEKYGTDRAGKAFKLPDYSVGTGVVYKVYDDISYVLVMDSSDVIYAKDRLVLPYE